MCLSKIIAAAELAETLSQSRLLQMRLTLTREGVLVEGWLLNRGRDVLAKRQIIVGWQQIDASDTLERSINAAHRQLQDNQREAFIVG